MHPKPVNKKKNNQQTIRWVSAKWKHTTYKELFDENVT